MSNFFRLGITALFLISCAYQKKDNFNDLRKPDSVPTELKINKIVNYSQQRGSPAEFDPGPSKDSLWPDIFAETPNYRAYGKAVYEAASQKAQIKDDGQEKFRWKVGPMWYRGRLTPESVKVFVIGQEGAQDENVSNRTFTGSTGTKMQNFINYFGITQSYLFMNTFIYTITGQYGERAETTDSADVKKQKEVNSNALFWLAQSENSVIVKHRHRMFDYMLDQNKNTLRLLIGVGSAGKDTLATWIRSHGGKCTAQQLGSSFCDASMVAPGVKAIGVMHPGAASARNGGSNAASSLNVQFAKRADLVSSWIKENPKWLEPDSGAQTNFSKAYQYRDAGIPYRDFAFGTNWRMGNDGTATNRRGADGIQIFSAQGCYNNAVRLENGRCDFAEKPKTLPLKYDEPEDLNSSPEMSPEDVAYESPKSKDGRRFYDLGPGEFASTLMGLDAGGWPNFNSLGITQDNSFGFGPIYRGDLKNPEVLILADQESQDDLFSTRALTGTGGQQLQTYLKLLSLKNNYVIIRTLPVDSLDLAEEKVEQIALNEQVLKVRESILNAILQQNKTKVILTLGETARKAFEKYKSSSTLPVFNLKSSLETQHVADWQLQLPNIARALNQPVAGNYSGQLTSIPRQDLPVHTRWWMGTSGSRAYRAYLTKDKNKQWNGDYYQFQAPKWVDFKKYPARASEILKPFPSDPNKYTESLNIFKSIPVAQ